VVKIAWAQGAATRQKQGIELGLHLWRGFGKDPGLRGAVRLGGGWVLVLCPQRCWGCRLGLGGGRSAGRAQWGGL
jgi:hypothetical protein